MQYNESYDVMLDFGAKQSSATQPQFVSIDEPTKKQAISSLQVQISPPKYSPLPLQSQLVSLDKPTKKQAVSPPQVKISPPKYSSLPLQHRISNIRKPNVPSRAARRCVFWSLLVTFLSFAALFCCAVILTAIIVGVLCATNVICLPTYYYYCPQGYDITIPTFNIPTTDNTANDWDIFSDRQFRMRYFFNSHFTIGYCGSDTTSSSTSYFCEVRQTNNNLQSYCVNSCTVSSTTDCNTPTISSTPLTNAVPFYTYVITDDQTNAARKIFSSGFTYVSCPANNYWDVSL